ncbi:tyrosine-type recombinase/integrase [Nocardia cyriacigeorgica]|uniref:tyrosine-type recombinase/integrase n=2 Tax=Nocardia cyriacigeorgica TaxID=135487 RepID=UPI001894C713|nr:tyrosine-type recombinase/integrase [Nocardia cyriacigeorgica]
MTADDLTVARMFLERLGIRPEDLSAANGGIRTTPTFADYIPRVSAAVPAGTHRTYSPYWRRLVVHWGSRQLHDPTPIELQSLVEKTRQEAVVRRNSRGGRSAAEHMVGALRCIYRFAARDGHIPAADDPASQLDKPRRLPSARTSLSHQLLTEIHHTAATTGNDPELDTLIIRLHLETACRTGSALALRPEDLDSEQSLIRLFGKNGTIHWQPVSPTLLRALQSHASRGTDPAGQLLRYHHGRPITRRRYDHLWDRLGRHLPWVATRQVTTHWLRYTTLTWVERNFGYATAKAFAAHSESTGQSGVTLTYVRASIEEVANALAALAGEPHPLASQNLAPSNSSLALDEIGPGTLTRGAGRGSEGPVPADQQERASQ